MSERENYEPSEPTYSCSVCFGRGLLLRVDEDGIAWSRPCDSCDLGLRIATRMLRDHAAARGVDVETFQTPTPDGGFVNRMVPKSEKRARMTKLSVLAGTLRESLRDGKAAAAGDERDDDDDDGISGQDRRSYSDEQDRESYTPSLPLDEDADVESLFEDAAINKEIG